MNEFEKRLAPMFETYFDDSYEFKDILKIIEEARQEFPLLKYMNKELKEGEVYAMSLNEVSSILVSQELFKWYVKWFS